MTLELYRFFLVIAELQRQSNTNKQNWKPCKMQSINIIQSNKFRFKKENPNPNSRGIKRSPSGRFLCSAGLFQSLEKSSVPQTTCHQKKEQLRKRAALFLLSAFPVSTRSLPAFVGATASATQTRKKNAGQCLRPPPLMFWRLLYRQPSTSIGTPEKGLNIIICSADASLVRLPLHAPVPTPPKKGAPGPGWLSVTATPPPVPQKKAFYRC